MIIISKLTGIEKKVQKKVKHSFRAAKIGLSNLWQPSASDRYIFHHLPKCGGTSAFDALTHWFICIKDYPPAWGDIDYPNAYQQFSHSPKKLDNLSHYHILCGHYHLPGSFLFERYPQCLKEKRYRLITFLRHPLEIQLSLYYYERRNQRMDCQEMLEKRLLLRQNYLASVIPCNESNYKKILEQYFFIGFVEDYQDSFDQLADILNKPRVQLQLLNSSPRDDQSLSRDFLSEFEEINCLDYKIYDYSRTLYNQRSQVDTSL